MSTSRQRPMLISSDRPPTPMRKIAPYWPIIALLLLGLLALYIYHLLTGFTPNRVIFQIPVAEFDIYWYAICIVGGISLGAYVVAQLAEERMKALLVAEVDAGVRERPLTSLNLPEEISLTLTRQNIHTVGDLLLKWGQNQRYLGLNQEGLDVVQAALTDEPDVAESWVQAPPWHIWSPDHVWSGISWCLVLGIVGARLYHVLTPSPSMAALGIESPLDYFRNPAQLINLRNGGLGIYGGMAGGLLGLFIYSRRQRIPMLGWADLCAIGVALGQVFGRWGNFFNQELYGRPTNVFWAVRIEPLYRLPAYSEFERFHPAFLYESLWSLLTFAVLFTLLRRRRLLTGDLLAAYLIFYAIGRSLLELVRLDSRTVMLGGLELNIAIATLVSLVVAVVMAVWLVLKHQLGKRPS
ncbi:MAG: prolipoprotein diacylglyceryl transferase [Ardenticatenaceae bacterium]|nr:prolipoprotein diacylglyceryl transferase [Ardenticatenaceae bacterium]